MTAYDWVAVPLSMLLLAAWIVTCVWLMQVRANAMVLNPGSTRARSTVWVWIGWFVPVVFLWFPFQVVRDARRATVSESRRSSQLVGWWWAFWLFYVGISRAAGRVTLSSDPDVDLGTLVSLEVFGAVFAIGACILWVLIVRQVTRDQSAAAASRPIGATPATQQGRAD